MTGQNRRLLIFTLGGERFALDLLQVAEVIESTEIFPVPRAPAWFPGVMNFHGALVAVLDLAAFLRMGRAPDQGKILVADRTIANLALKIDSIEGIVPEEMILETQDVDDDLLSRLLTMADGEIRELDMTKLVAGLETTINVGDGNGPESTGTRQPFTPRLPEV